MAISLNPGRLNRPKIAAMALLAVPLTLLLALTIGETVGGGWSGLQHLAQAAPLLVILMVAWRRPYAAGIASLALGAVAFVLWLVFAVRNLEPAAIVLTAAMLFVPALIAGWLLVQAGRRAP